MNGKIKRILTVDDLIQFCQEQNFTNFSSKEMGYQLALKIPTTFEVEENIDDNHRGMMKLKFRIFHTGLNRNGSNVSKEAATKAMNTIADRPVLAAIHQLDDGTWDFEGHEMEVVTNENGDEELRYIESQVGSFSSEPAFWEHDDKLDKDYVCAYAYISKEYTKASEIIERKNGTKNSCELFVDEFAYNAKEKYLDLIDFYVNASTLLGARSDGTQIQEGMIGSRADIVDFSVENNSIKFDKDKKLIELLENLNKTLSNFNKYHLEEGGKCKNMLEKLLEKYGKTVEDIKFDYAGLSDEELEEKFKEAFEESEVETEDNLIKNENDNETHEQFENIIRTYEISHEDIRYALYQLLEDFESADNEWYFINSVYDTYFTYENWDGDKIYGQAYTKDGDNVSFDGERYNLHRELLTDSEYAELQSMRSNYAALKEFKENFEKSQLHAQKEEILNSDKYSLLFEKNESGEYINEKVANLVNNMDNYSLTDFETQIKIIHSDYISEHSTFSYNAEKEKKKVIFSKTFSNVNRPNKNNRYGKLKFN